MAHRLRGPASATSAAYSGQGVSNGMKLTLSYFRPCMRQGRHHCLEGHNLTNHKTTDGCPPPLRLVHSCASLTSDAATLTSHESDATSSDADDGLADRAEAESEQILEWPAVCKQVACFCGTSVAADLVARGNLPRGRSREESELLLQQTAEAAEANLEVQGCFDIRPAVEAAAAGACLNAKQLEGVASTLKAAFALQIAATAPDDNDEGEQEGGGDEGGARPRPRRGRRHRFPALAALAGGIGEEERTTLRAIRACIKLSSVSSDASEALAAIRAERQTNKEALRAEVEGWARLMVARGAAEAGAVSIVRGRFCVGVRAGRQGELPKGSVRLSASSTGATLYVEPAPCVPLNNAEALLQEREEGEVTRVLALLSKLLGSRAPQVLQLLDSVTCLDVVAARAKHSRWLGGVRPSFEIEPGASPLHVPGARHPVLMQRGLPPLPQPPSVDDNRFDRDFQAAGAWELRRVFVPDGPRPGEMPYPGSTTGGGAEGEGEEGPMQQLLPRPLDLRVPSGRSVVAITGPNTGGKTVSLKAAGLMVLMAQAGLYLPCDPAALATHGSPRLTWFDRVLADIGDAQSLQQNLSTFSGHIRRIRQILASAGGRSLVLLDEVGSGTDPLEGAALARAVLDRLAGQAHLTLATTHHAELKRAADEDPRFVNCSMAFDTATLRPTYVLCWGAAGASNALDIAEALGFDRSVVLEARGVAQALAASTSSTSSSASSPSSSPSTSSSPEDRDSHIAVVARSLVRQLDETRQELEAQQALRLRREEARALLLDTLSQVREMEQQLKLSPREIVMERDSLAAEVQSALDAFAAGLQPQAPVEEALRRIEALIPEEVAAYRGQEYDSGGGGGDDEGERDGGEQQALRPGDSVHVRSYGDMGSAKVLSVKGDYVTVKFDMMLPLGARSGRSRKFHKREVQRVSGGGAGPLLGTSAWMYDKYTGLESDIRKVLGQLSAQERAAAEEAAARIRSQRMAAQEAGLASYGDLYDALDVDQLSEDLDEQIIEDPDLAELVDSLGQEDEQDELDEQAAWSRGRQQQRGSSSSSSASGAAAATGPKRAAAVAAAAAAAVGRTKGRSDGGDSGGGGSSSRGGGVQLGVPESTEDNTLDLAGEVPELAAADLDDRLREEPPGSVLFVRHGLGTGAVRDAVHEVLTRRSSPKGRVLEWREAPGSRGEVTVVWLT
ncbi:hypothetical protein PLESTB_001197300 [Pleodorina starrii]|uniref:DNA mismatch repair proteins mutS family domain-containing protein n=1 Tax=Pleodorina starrii TaxID=330485 RepID=A0A9W6F5N5_9CHLO|nr:hypothetical protein PLESTM_001834800 [Pleodorina starrii]GLC57194.1 hypothetical protein PLESTB_001197300 [Pleodorina starrii]GLC71425.1 hypothetical protein PLESTF_001114600 [Pleodorina starrii]